MTPLHFVTPLDHVTTARKPVLAPNGVVATSHPLAAQSGLSVLRAGGNAVDAAIATAATLTVVQPTSTDVGGDLFALVWDDGELSGLNGSGRAPMTLTADAVRAAGATTMPRRGWQSVTIPGVPAGWRDLHARYGRAPFGTLFEDAIGYAERGFPVSPTVAYHWQQAAELHHGLSGEEYTGFAPVFLPDGKVPRAGERWRNPDLARTLWLIAGTYAESFYHGETSTRLVDFSARTGGYLDAEDLLLHSSSWVAPLSVSYRGYDVWELPPNGQGLAALLALAILDGLSAPEHGVALHQQLEAMKLAFADARRYIADPTRAAVPVDELLSKEYVSQRRALIGDRAAAPAHGKPGSGDTVYLATADAEGMMVSLIQSNYSSFGSHVVVPRTGIALQNRAAGFSLEPDHPNCLAPGKRPFHTIIPGFLSRGGTPVGPFGVMGGHMQPQGHVQLLVHSLDRGLDPQAALDAPRWYWSTGRAVTVESSVPAEVVAALRERGHEVTVADDSDVFGCGQAIWRLPDGGYVAGSEARTDGCALGY